MPKRVQKSISEVAKTLEPKRKNPILLRDDELLDTHFKTLKIGGKTAPLEMSTGKARFSGNLLINKVEGDINVADGDVNLNEGGKLRFDNSITTGFSPITAGNSYINVESDIMYFYVGGEKLLTIGQNFGLGTVDKITTFTSNLSIDEGQKLYFEGMDSDSYLHRTTGDVFEFYGDGTKLFSIQDDGDVVIHGGSLYLENGEYIDNSVDGTVSIKDSALGTVCLSTSTSGIFTNKLYLDSLGGHTYLDESSDDVLDIYVGAVKALVIAESGEQLRIPATWNLVFDGDVGSTYISESSDDVLSFYVGTDKMLVLDEANDKITMGATNWVAGTVSGGTVTEFSVANSAFAGMILGIRTLGHNPGRVGYTITTSFTTLHADATVRFIAPPSGVVEVYVQAGYLDAGSARIISFGLSDNATYNTLGAEHEESVNQTDETDQQIIQNTWVISGLTAGDTYNYWFGLKASSALPASTLNYGGTGSGHYSPFIMKVTSLPTAVSDFAVYD